MAMSILELMNNPEKFEEMQKFLIQIVNAINEINQNLYLIQRDVEAIKNVKNR